MKEEPRKRMKGRMFYPFRLCMQLRVESNRKLMMVSHLLFFLSFMWENWVLDRIIFCFFFL